MLIIFLFEILIINNFRILIFYRELIEEFFLVMIYRSNRGFDGENFCVKGVLNEEEKRLFFLGFRGLNFIFVIVIF